MPKFIPNFSSHRIWWTLLLLAIISFMSVYIGLTFDEELGSVFPETSAVSSIFNAKPSGLKGLYEIVNRAGLTCRAWQEPYRNLKRVNGILLIVEPLRSLSFGEVNRILDWVSNGNELIYLDYFNFPPISMPLFEQAGLAYKQNGALASVTVPAKMPDKEFAHIKNLVVSSNARIIGGNILMSDKDGALLTEITYGKGRILVGLMTGFCANQQLQDKITWDNFQFMVNLLSTTPGIIYFDERCHGYCQSANLFLFLLRNTPGLVASQAALILAIAVASSAQRFGRIRELRPTRQISNWQFIEGLANAYAHTGAQAVALEIIVQDFKSCLRKILTLPVNTETAAIVSTLQDLSSQSGGNLAKFLADYEQALNEERLSATTLKKLINNADQIAREINEIFETAKSS